MTLIKTILANTIAEELNEASFITEHEREDVVKLIEEIWKDYAMDVWNFQNVASEIIARGFPFSRAAAREILAKMEKNLDSDQGFNWDTLHNAIQKWEKKMSSRWLTLSDAQRLEFSEETCRWAIVSEIELSTAVAYFGADTSLLDVVIFARNATDDKERVRVYAILLDDEYSLEDIFVLGLLVWDSRPPNTRKITPSEV
jgi:hypothetical protein